MRGFRSGHLVGNRRNGLYINGLWSTALPPRTKHGHKNNSFSRKRSRSITTGGRCRRPGDVRRIAVGLGGGGHHRIAVIGGWGPWLGRLRGGMMALLPKIKGPQVLTLSFASVRGAPEGDRPLSMPVLCPNCPYLPKSAFPTAK